MLDISHQIKDKVASNLLALTNELKHVSLQPFYNTIIKSTQFELPEKLLEIAARIPLSDHPVLYRFSCPNKKQLNQLVETYLAFNPVNRARTLRKDRLNMSKLNNSGSSTLYVGSTRCNKKIDFRKRMTQHLGGGNLRTYAMQLSKWHENAIYTLQLDALHVISSHSDCVTQPLLELIEQTYWEEYKPVFGKKAGL